MRSAVARTEVIGLWRASGSERPVEPVKGRLDVGAVAVAVANAIALDRRRRRHADRLADFGLDLLRHVGMLAQELACVVLALPDLVAGIGVPRARLLDD